MELVSEITSLPSLREDIRLFPGAEEEDGSPSWVLQDPSRNRFFRIGWVEFELLRRWKGADPQSMLAQVNQQTALQVDEGHLRDLLGFLAQNQLILGRGEQYRDQLVKIAQQSRQDLSSWLLHHYLFFRIPLVRPDAFLQATYPLVKPLFSAAFFHLLLLFSLLGLFLISRRWDEFSTTFMHFYSLEGLLLFGVAVSFSKIIHELGHAYTATRFGLKVPTMGVAFLVLWPVLYTESSEAWKLANRRQRLLIAGAGMMAELSLAACAALLWNFLDDGPARSAVFMLATSTWVLTLLVNINPFMRFDGYYLLSDLLGFANLQDRSFELARWRMREILFGFNRPPPEVLEGKLHRFLIYYAWGTWIYRFFLFLGIALLVYYMFFKALGLFLMVVEIGWFILRPIFREFAEWARSGDEMRLNRQVVTTLLLLGMLLTLLVVPWRSSVDLPSILFHPQQSNIFPVEAGRVEQIHVRLGDSVNKGDLLFRLDSPDLQQRTAQAESDVAILRLELERKATGEDYQQYRGVLAQQLAEAQSTLEGLQQRLLRLDVRAPTDGRVLFLEEGLSEGRWVATRTLLARIVESGQFEIQSYVEGRQVQRLSAGTMATFYPEDALLPKVELQLRALEDTNTRYLKTAYLASEYGGSLPTRTDDNGRILSETTLFRAIFDPLNPSAQLPSQMIRGEVRVEVESQSPLSAFFNNVVSVLVRESGF